MGGVGTEITRSLGRMLRYERGVLAFLGTMTLAYSGLALLGPGYVARVAELFRVASCISILAFALNTARVNAEPSSLFLGPSFAFIALLETAYALVRSERPAGWEGLGLSLRLLSAWYMASAYFLLAWVKRHGMNRFAVWATEAGVLALSVLPLLLGYRPPAPDSERYLVYAGLNAAGLLLALAFSILRIRRAFPSGRYRRRLMASAAFAALSLPLAFLPPSEGALGVWLEELLRSMGFFFVYKAVVSQALMRPYRSMFRRIRLEKSELSAANAGLTLALREKMDLIREVHHRVKNNLQIIAGLLYLADEASTDPAARETLRDSQERLRSVALAHELLYRDPDASQVDIPAYVRRLLDSIGGSFGRPPRVETEIAEISLPLERTLPLGLVINELLTNAVKYGGRNGEPPRVRLTLAVDAEAAGGGDLVLEVEDDGPGLPPGFDPETSAGLGYTLLRSHASQLGGSLSWSGRGGGPEGDGLRVRLVFPAREVPGKRS